tara:strand:- start:506 stop:895 length:390 start_codon:yes stop_codon:yes gene_type:complete
MNNTNYKREKDFGIVFIVIFTLLLLYSFFFNDQKYLIIFLVFLFIIATSTFIKPGFLRIPSILWLDFAKIVSKITNPIIFSLIFVTLFSTLGIIFRIFRIDLLNQKILKEKKTYWQTKKAIKTSVNNQF